MTNVSISGRANEGDPDAYWCNLFNGDKKWSADGTDHGTNLFKTKSGRWLYKAIPDKGVYANDASGNVVLFFRNLDPATVKAGDQGSGHAYESGRTINWKVDSL
jgi:hypothetical protein